MDVLRKEIQDDYLSPVKTIQKCDDVKRMVEGKGSKPFSLVLF